MDVRDIQQGTFDPLQGEAFVAESDVDRHTLRLLRVERLRNGAAGREPFSVLFQGPAEPVIPQQTFTLVHDALGRLAVFMVPVGRDGDPRRGPVLYEAVFS